MQPLYSVDHETRNNANREADIEPLSSETTPLLQQQRFPDLPPQTSLRTTLVVSVLLVILVAGAVIGIYLLVIQDDSENILPPVPLQLVTRSQWDEGHLPQSPQESLGHNLMQVMVMPTGTQQCMSTKSCTQLLQAMKGNYSAANATLPYNFLISSNGEVYEALGWQRSSPLLTTPSSGLLLGFIGNFTQVEPTSSQLEGAKHFFDESVSQRVLHPSYTITCNKTEGTANYLYQSLKKFPNSELSSNN